MNPDEVVENPWSKLEKIFISTANTHSSQTLDRLRVKIGPETSSISMDRYQTMVRALFVELVAESGLNMHSFPSVDRDEDFLKIYLPLDGPIIEHMAEHLDYAMPFKTSVYEIIKPHGPYPGREPMHDSQGRHLVAWDRFSIHEANRFEPFSKRDSIRLLEFWLDEWVSLDEMERQGGACAYVFLTCIFLACLHVEAASAAGIITCYFPCPEPDALANLHNHFLNLCKWVHFQGDQADELSA